MLLLALLFCAIEVEVVTAKGSITLPESKLAFFDDSRNNYWQFTGGVHMLTRNVVKLYRVKYNGKLVESKRVFLVTEEGEVFKIEYAVPKNGGFYETLSKKAK